MIFHIHDMEFNFPELTDSDYKNLPTSDVPIIPGLVFYGNWCGRLFISKIDNINSVKETADLTTFFFDIKSYPVGQIKPKIETEIFLAWIRKIGNVLGYI